MKRPIALLILGYACLSAAWIIGNPPFAAPDEPAHFVRAAALAHGEGLAGSDPAYPDRPGPKAGQELVPPIMRFGSPQRAWSRAITRSVHLPRRLVPGLVACNTFFTFLPAGGCKNPPLKDGSRTVAVRTYAGTFPPLPHLIAAGGIAFGAASADSGVRAGRAALALACLLLLAVGFLASASRAAGLSSIVGIVLAMTPMAVFLSASVGSSGLTAAASIAFLACLFRTTRAGAVPGWIPVAAAAAGAVLAVSRSEGPAWLALDLMAVAALGSPQSLRVTFRSRAWIAVGLALLSAVVVNRVWDSIYAPNVDFSLDVARQALRRESATLLFGVMHQAVGSFNWLETPVPTLLAVAWWLLVALAFGIAVTRMASSRRAPVLAFLVLVIAVPHLFAIVLYEIGRWDIDGRYVLPAVVALAVLSGEAFARTEDLGRRLRDLLPRLVLALVALMQLWAWWWNARRQATGDHASLWFLTNPVWSPPTGWVLPAMLAAVGAAALMAVALRAPAAQPMATQEV